MVSSLMSLKSSQILGNIWENQNIHQRTKKVKDILQKIKKKCKSKCA